MEEQLELMMLMIKRNKFVLLIEKDLILFYYFIKLNFLIKINLFFL